MATIYAELVALEATDYAQGVESLQSHIDDTLHSLVNDGNVVVNVVVRHQVAAAGSWIAHYLTATITYRHETEDAIRQAGL